MFLHFFYELRKNRIPVSTGEYLDMIGALQMYNSPITIRTFYFIARSTLVKDVRYYDAFDLVFAQQFKDYAKEGSDDLFRRLLEDWLSKGAQIQAKPGESPAYSADELWQELQKRLREQNSRHDGGSKWVGTQGRSPFGHSGENKAGVRIGGEGRNRTAIDVFDSMGARRYQEYRNDARLSVRQFQIALRGLRDLRRLGRPELSLPLSVLHTAKNGGNVEVVLQRSRKNRLRLILLMDVGGSMTPHTALVSRLFSAAAKANHFQLFKHYYFHNIIYESLFEDAGFEQPVAIDDFLRSHNEETRLIFVGDASMNPFELFDKRHAFFEFFYRSGKDPNSLPGSKSAVLSGYERLQQLKTKYRYSVWLNPDARSAWQHETVEAVADIIPMFSLTVDGLQSAVRSLSVVDL